MHTCNPDRVFRGPSEAQEHDMVVDFTHEVAKNLKNLNFLHLVIMKSYFHILNVKIEIIYI